MCPSPEALGPGSRRVPRRRYADPPAGAFLTGLGTAVGPAPSRGAPAAAFLFKRCRSKEYRRNPHWRRPSNRGSPQAAAAAVRRFRTPRSGWPRTGGIRREPRHHRPARQCRSPSLRRKTRDLAASSIDAESRLSNQRQLTGARGAKIAVRMRSPFLPKCVRRHRR